MVRALIASGAPSDKVDEFGWSPIATSCQNGALETVKVLLEAQEKLLLGAVLGECRPSMIQQIWCIWKLKKLCVHMPGADRKPAGMKCTHHGLAMCV